MWECRSSAFVQGSRGSKGGIFLVQREGRMCDGFSDKAESWMGRVSCFLRC